MFHAIHIINIISYSCVHLLNFQANSSRHSMYTSCCTSQRLLETLVVYGLIHAFPLRIITAIYENYSMAPRMLMARFVFNSTRTCICNSVSLQILVIKMMLHIIIIIVWQNFVSLSDCHSSVCHTEITWNCKINKDIHRSYGFLWTPCKQTLQCSVSYFVLAV